VIRRTARIVAGVLRVEWVERTIFSEATPSM
jgi:hypothetical protein